MSSTLREQLQSLKSDRRALPPRSHTTKNTSQPVRRDGDHSAMAHDRAYEPSNAGVPTVVAKGTDPISSQQLLRQGGSAAHHKPASVSREQMIAEAAYFRYEKRRGTDGDPAGDWLEAEQEIGWMLESDTER